MMISSVKHDEYEDEALKEWKSRYVALGNKILHTDGKKVEEDALFWA